MQYKPAALLPSQNENTKINKCMSIVVILSKTLYVYYYHVELFSINNEKLLFISIGLNKRNLFIIGQ